MKNTQADPFVGDVEHLVHLLAHVVVRVEDQVGIAVFGCETLERVGHRALIRVVQSIRHEDELVRT